MVTASLFSGFVIQFAPNARYRTLSQRRSGDEAAIVEVDASHAASASTFGPTIIRLFLQL
jgi:hypothetical protein